MEFLILDHSVDWKEKKLRLKDLFNNFRWQICCFALWRATTNQKRQSRRWIQNLQMSELFFLFSYTLNQNLTFFFSIILDGKYVVLPSGELQIRNVSPEDGFKTYKCRTKHRLTGETKLSATAGRLVITGKSA